jgi:hypothetical protein
MSVVKSEDISSMDMGFSKLKGHMVWKDQTTPPVPTVSEATEGLKSKMFSTREGTALRKEFAQEMTSQRTKGKQILREERADFGGGKPGTPECSRRL